MPEDQFWAVRRDLPDGRILLLVQRLFHWDLTVGRDMDGWEEQYTYHSFIAGVTAINEWDGTGDAPGPWVRHVPSDRRRPNGDATQEYIHP